MKIVLSDIIRYIGIPLSRMSYYKQSYGELFYNSLLTGWEKKEGNVFVEPKDTENNKKLKALCCFKNFSKETYELLSLSGVKADDIKPNLLKYSQTKVIDYYLVG